MTLIKRGQTLCLRVDDGKVTRYFRWVNDKLPPITRGRIGLRQMWTRTSVYRDVRVSVPAAK